MRRNAPPGRRPYRPEAKVRYAQRRRLRRVKCLKLEEDKTEEDLISRRDAENAESKTLFEV